MKTVGRHQLLLWPVLALIVGFAISLAAAFEAQKRAQAESLKQFTLQVDRLEQDILSRFDKPVSGLRGMVGFYAASEKITRKDFRDYWEARDIAKEFPGVRGYGYIARVKRDELDSFVIAERNDEEPSFTVKTQGAAEELFVIKLIEPIFNNRPAQGLDIGSEPVRYAGVLQAIRTGEPTLTGVISLVQAESKTPGFLYLLPQFRRGTAPETEAQRRSALVGFVYMPLVANELLAPSVLQTQGLTDFELFDGIKPSRENLVFFNNKQSESSLLSQNSLAQSPKSRKLEANRVIEIGGRSLTLHASSTPAFEALTESALPGLIGGGGALLTLFIAFSIGLIAKGRAAAEERVTALSGEMVRLAKVSESTTNLVMIADNEHRLVWVNDAFEGTTGFSREAAEGKTAAELLGFEQHTSPEVLQRLRTAMTERSSIRLPIQGVSAKGRRYWLDADLQFTQDEDGQPTGYVALAADVTDAKQAELVMNTLTLQLQSVLNAATEVAIITTNRERKITLFNAGAQNLLGYAPEEVVGLHNRTLFHDALEMAERADLLSAELGRPVEGVGVFIQEPYLGKAQFWTCVRKDGSRFDASEVFTAMYAPDGELLGYLSLTQDISQQKAYEISLQEARERAEQATLAKGQFLANMSHEIRTPMNAILGMLHLMHKTPLTSKQTDYTAKAERAAKSLLSLINDILDFSKVEAGKMTLDAQPFRLDRLMRDLSVIVSANVGNKPVEVLFDIDPDLPEVLLGDAMRLQQVLINLAGNAIKFTERGNVVIGLRMEGQRVHFSVKDSGIGIAPENQAKIFSGFSQAEASTTRRFGGTGLGLSISKRLVELMGGSLSLQSALDVGSTFSFALPLQPVLDIPDTLKRLPRDHTESLHVLVIDDNPVACELMIIMLRSLGWQAQAASGGEEALRLIEQRQKGIEPQFQVIFIDWQMQGMDGWEAARRIRKLGHPALSKEPLLLMVTGHGREMLSQRTEREQSLLNGFLVKPVTASILFDAVMDAGNPEAMGEASLKAPSSERRLEGMRLLVVEDNLINQQVAEELLSSEGAQVSLAANGQIGVEAVAAANPQFDVVLMDLQMPVLDGFGATRKIRDELGLKRLPIIAMTANALDSDRTACLEADMTDHVGKPFDLSHLVETLLKHTGFVAQHADITPKISKSIAIESISQRVLSDFQSEGLDISAALDRMGGDSTLYLKVLNSFMKDIAGSADQLATHLATDNTQDAIRQMHTLKGLAATVGASALANFARDAEHQLKTGLAPGTKDAQALIAQTQDAVRSASRVISAVIAAGEPKPGGAKPTSTVAAPPFDQERALAQLRQLLALLTQSDMEALMVFSQLQKDLGPNWPASGAEAFAELRKAMDAFDFSQAALQCDTLIQNLQT